MAHTGNARANAALEARLDPSQKPSYYSPDLESFIRRKVSVFLLPVHVQYLQLKSAQQLSLPFINCLLCKSCPLLGA